MITKHKLKHIINEAIKETIWSTPDTIHSTDINGGSAHFRTDTAIPFFVMNNNKIIYGEKAKRHLDYFNNMPTNERHRFTSSIKLQGRYWSELNAFSFWYIGEDTSLIIDTVTAICEKFKRSPKTAKVYYRDRILSLNYDKDFDTYEMNDNRNDYEDYVEQVERDETNPNERIAYWFQSTGDFVNNNYGMLVYDKTRQPRFEPLNKHQWLCVTTYQIYNDFLKNDSSKQFSFDDFDSYIHKNYKASFKSLMNEFQSKYRNHLITRQDFDSFTKNEYEPNDLESIIMDAGLHTSEYKIVTYDGTDNVYSAEIKTEDYDKYQKVIALAKVNNLVIDRVNSYKMGDGINIYFLRLRLPAA